MQTKTPQILQEEMLKRVEDRYRVARRWNKLHYTIPAATLFSCLLAAALSTRPTAQTGSIFWAMTAALGVVVLLLAKTSTRRDTAIKEAWKTEDLLNEMNSDLEKEGRRASDRKKIVETYEKKWIQLNRNLPLMTQNVKMLEWFDSMADITGETDKKPEDNSNKTKREQTPKQITNPDLGWMKTD